MVSRKTIHSRGQAFVQHPKNPFEKRVKISKHEIVGKYAQAEKRLQTGKHGKQSGNTEKRKRQLLLEYSQKYRGNSYIDKRFGEDDHTLSADDKALARFQKQRLKDITGVDDQAIFLGRAVIGKGEVDRERLTLSVLEGKQEDPHFKPENHFGVGNSVKPQENPRGGNPGTHRSKKEVMEEVIAKSKAFKAEKARQKEVDFDATEHLNKMLAHIVEAGDMAFLRVPSQGQPAALLLEEERASAYDQAKADLIFQAKAQAVEPTLNSEETADPAERHNLSAAKYGFTSPVGQEVEHKEECLLGGYAARRAKRCKREAGLAAGVALDDELYFSDGSSSENDGSTGVGRKQQLSLDDTRRQKAAGNHPLQERFRDISGQLLQKYGLTAGQESNKDEEKEEQAMNRKDTDMTDTRSSANCSNIAISDNGKGLQVTASVDVLGLASMQTTALPDSSESQAFGQTSLAAISSPEEMYAWFARLVEKQSATQLGITIRTIKTQNEAIFRSDNKRKLQAFYSVLVQRFAHQAGDVPLPLEELNTLVKNIQEITTEVPFYAASTALARLQKLQQQLAAAEDRRTDGNSAWPTQQQLLLLKLWATVFPATYLRHPVLSPAALLVAAHLAVCHVSSLQDVAKGLFLAALGLRLASSANQVMTEPLQFVICYLGKAAGTLQRTQVWRQWQIEVIPEGGWTSFSAQILPLTLKDISCKRSGLEESCLLAAISVLHQCVLLYGDSEAFPELFEEANRILRCLQHIQIPQVEQSLPRTGLNEQQGFQAGKLQGAREECKKGLELLQNNQEAKELQRAPLKKQVNDKEIKLYNPRFEETYHARRDIDPDRDRAEARKLKRLVTKERRGAIRELRQDAHFLGEHIEDEQAADRANIRSTLRKNSNWLASLENDFKSGGQGGYRKKARKK